MCRLRLVREQSRSRLHESCVSRHQPFKLAKHISAYVPFEDLVMILTMVRCQGRLDLADPESSDEMRLEFEGIHVVSTGSVYAYAESPG